MNLPRVNAELVVTAQAESKMDYHEKLKSWCRRKPNGEFFNPRTVYVHRDEIMRNAPSLVSEEELLKIKRNFGY